MSITKGVLTRDEKRPWGYATDELGHHWATFNLIGKPEQLPTCSACRREIHVGWTRTIPSRLDLCTDCVEVK